MATGLVKSAETKAYFDEIEYWLEVCADDEDDPIHKVTQWRLAYVPIDVFGCTFNRSELGKHYDNAKEDEREKKILGWVNECGSWDAATKQSPIIALHHDGKWDKVDGWHRMKLAKISGETHVWCLVGDLP